MSTDVVGLIPAAGRATRISPLPGSKELFPVGFRDIEVNGHVQIRPKVVSQYLLDNMFCAGARKVWMVLGRGKSDIMEYYGDGTASGGNIAYLLMDKLWGMPYTLDLAWPWINSSTVLFGMPDTIFTPHDTFRRLLDNHNKTGAAVTLGVFPTDRPEKLCVVDMDANGKVKTMVDKPKQTQLRVTWGCACWAPEFSNFMHTYLAGKIAEAKEREVVLADVFLAAIDANLPVHGVHFVDGEYIDIGTPEDLAVAVHRFSKQTTGLGDLN